MPASAVYATVALCYATLPPCHSVLEQEDGTSLPTFDLGTALRRHKARCRQFTRLSFPLAQNPCSLC